MLQPTMSLDHGCDALQREHTDLANEIACLTYQIAAMQLRVRCNSASTATTTATVVWPLAAHASAHDAPTAAGELPPKSSGAVRFLCISDTHNQHTSLISQS